MTEAIPTSRLEARISTELYALLKRAAEIEGCTVSDFVLSAVRGAAQRTVEQSDVIRLSVADQERFAAALMSPAKPTAALTRAFSHRNKMLGA